MMKLDHPSLFREKNYVNGLWINADNADTFEVFNPFDGSLVGRVPNAGRGETLRAIMAAKAAFEDWKDKTAKERADILTRWANLIDKHKADLAKILTTEQGKPLMESEGEITYGNRFNYWFAEEAKRVYGDVIPTVSNDRRLLVIKQPIGVCAAITPWNFPCAMITRKCAPALAVGCTVVIKPAGATPFSALALAALAEEAGFPPGVLNVVTGDPVAIGQELSCNPMVSKLSFTGSTQVGKILMKQGCDTVKKMSLELGGNAPFIIFDDADLEAALIGVKVAKFRNSGQSCVAANRIYVQDSLYDAFISQLQNIMKTLKVGNGLDQQVTIGPLINQSAVEKIEQLIEDAVAMGAKVICGGKRDTSSQNAYEPTLITDIPPAAKIVNTEIFGPVAAVYRFKTEAEVIAQANNTQYGLASYFYSRDIGRIWRVAEALEFGMTAINQGLLSNEVAPFGGVKESGFGREGSKYGVEDYLNIKYLCMGF